MINKNNSIRFWLLIALLFGGLFLAACSSSGGAEPAVTEDEEHEGDDHEEDEDHDHNDHAEDRIPNEGGATITITSPEDGATFSTLDQVLVEVSVANFDLGADGNHWHVYVDGVSYGMVMGGNTDQALPGLEPGEHEISVFMSIGSHEEYEDGDSVMIMVEE